MITEITRPRGAVAINETKGLHMHFHIQNDELAHKFQILKPFQSKDETRYYIMGVYLHISDGLLTGVATDGHTLCKAVIASEPAEDNGDSLDFIVPIDAVSHLIKLAKDRKKGACLVDFQDGKASFDFGDFKYETKCIDGLFPDYAKLFPDRSTASSYNVNAKYLKNAIAALGGKGIDIETPADPQSARILSSQDAEGVVCLIMPIRV